MLAAEREDDALLRRRRLQLEVEALAEFLAQREAPRAVDAAAEGRVQHELHAARLVEEALERDAIHSRHDAEAALRFREVLGDLLGRGARHAVVALEQLDRAIQIARLPRLLRPGELEIHRRAQA